MTFITDYLEAIDVIAILALVALAVAAFVRRENIWLGLLLAVLLLWAATRLFGLF
jgi:hypothetical protein